MSSSNPSPFFDAANALKYEERWAPLNDFRDSLHLQLRFVFAHLPEEARILCVGAGTGAEILALAPVFPRWSFIAVDPSAPMLEICRQRVTERGLAHRVALHEGTLDSLPAMAPCDAATSILVSQFITDLEERVDFYKQIHARLRPGGVLVTSDLTALKDPEQQRLLEPWKQMMRFVGSTEDRIEATLSSYGRDVVVATEDAMLAILTRAGFAPPVRFCQSLLIQSCFTQRA